MKNEFLIGAAGTGITFGLGALNFLLGCTAGLLTCCILAIRLRREWKHRDDPPPDE